MIFALNKSKNKRKSGMARVISLFIYKKISTDFSVPFYAR